MEYLIVTILILLLIIFGLVINNYNLGIKRDDLFNKLSKFEEDFKKIGQYMFRSTAPYTIEKILYKLKLIDKETIDRNRYLENALYDIENLGGKERPELNFSEMLKDIKQNRIKSIELDNIKPDYEKLVIYKKEKEKDVSNLKSVIESKKETIIEIDKKYSTLIKELRKDPKIDRDIRNGTTIQKIIQSILEKINKFDIDFKKYVDHQNKINDKKDKEIKEKDLKVKDLGKRIHVKDQVIYEIRKKHNIPAPKKRKAGQVRKK